MRVFILFLTFACAIYFIDCPANQESKQIKESNDQLGEEHTLDPFVFVVFGATGDLTSRKLLPAMYHLGIEGHLSQNTAVIAFARREYKDGDFRLKIEKALEQFSRTQPVDKRFWGAFEKKIFYHSSDFESDIGYEKLGKLLEKMDQEYGTKGNRIYFLAVQPAYFPIIIEKLHAHHLLAQKGGRSNSWSRVIIEKPFGSDLSSAIKLQDHLDHYLDDSQIYRMDHYLGKEGVQNLLSFRFESSLFEPLWNNLYIDHVQITLAEEIGIGSRANFWEETGALRDLLQSHLIQLLALISMDRPSEMNSKAIQEEKLKLLHAIRPFPPEKIDDYAVRGQYGSGNFKGATVPGYREEEGVPAASPIETFFAVKFFIDNPRWEGVPFYIRAGKRLAKQATEILVVFKKNSEFDESEGCEILIRIQPKAGIYIKTLGKAPGMVKQNRPVVFGYQPDIAFKTTSPEAYEKLIFDCAKGDSTLYVNGEEQLAAWRLLTPILNRWKAHPPENFPNYKAGTWGPEAADCLLEKQGHRWRSFIE